VIGDAAGIITAEGEALLRRDLDQLRAVFDGLREQVRDAACRFAGALPAAVLDGVTLPSGTAATRAGKRPNHGSRDWPTNLCQRSCRPIWVRVPGC